MSKDTKTVGIKEGTDFVPFGQVDVDRKWNSRNKYGKEFEGDDWGPFVASFGRGQDTPIILMPHPDAKRVAAGKLFFLVSGHRRFEAVQERAAMGAPVPGLPSGTIRAEIRKMSWADARETNIRENKAREDVTAADTVWAYAQFQKDLKAENRKMNQTDMAVAFGVKQGYISRLNSVYEAFDLESINKWRDSQLNVTLRDVEGVAKANEGDDKKDDRKKALDKLLKPAEGSNGSAGSNGADWVMRAKKRAVTVGNDLAMYEAAGFCDVSIARVFTKKNLHHFLSVREMTENSGAHSKLESILEAGREAYEGMHAAIKKKAEEKEAAEEAAAKKDEEKAAAAATKPKKSKKGAEAAAN